RPRAPRRCRGGGRFGCRGGRGRACRGGRREGRAWRSGSEAGDDPAASAARRVEEAVVEAARPPLPELVAVRDDAEAAPERWARDGLGVAEARFDLGEAGVEGGAVGHGAALRRGPGAEAAAARATGEVGVGLLGRHRLDTAFDADLALYGGPPEDERRCRMGP